MAHLFDSRGYRTVVTAWFAIWLLAPGIAALLGFGTDLARIEGRDASPKPVWPQSVERLVRYPRDLEAYLDDSFGFRSQLLTGHSLVYLALGMSGSPNYVVGRNDWFYHRSVDEQLDQARGLDVFTQHELEVWIRTMERRQRWLEKRGIEFLVVIAPSKHSIYPEHLPSWATPVGPTRYDQLRDRLATRPSPLEFIELRDVLHDAKAQAQVYRRTDDHWNDLGAYVAYEQIARRIAKTHPKLPVLSIDELTLATNRQAVGTITRGLNLTQFVEEDLPVLLLPRPTQVIDFRELGEGPVFGHKHIALYRTAFADRPSVLFFRDSFSEPVARMLSQTAHRTILAHHRNGGFRRSVVERFEPDVVVYQMIERGLRWRLTDR